jgi:O-antigen ligase
LPETVSRLLLPALSLLLTACWVGGGVTADATSIDEWLQLLALPVMLLAAMALAGERMLRLLRWGAGLCVLVALVPALQLLPLPASTWGMPAARHALGIDLAQAGVTIAPHWSLAPSATEQALWSLLPALAAFFSAAALPQQQRRRLLQVVVLLVGCNLLFAFFQAGLPQDSELRLYSDFNAGFGGLFANTNHQATACIIGMVLSVGLAAEARLRARRGEAHPHRRWWYLGAAAGFLLMVPLSTSRAGMAIALPALALALLLTGTLRPGQIGRSRRTTALALGVSVLAVLGVHAAMGWMAVDQAEELRHTMATAAIAMGNAEAPLGSGIGSFVPVFAQAAPDQLRMASYVNHAHNEYAQWWLVAGWLGMAVLAAALALLAYAGWRIARSEGRSAVLAAACLAALCAVLAHSWADYPLRTLTLMATTGALAGVMLASLADARERRPRTDHA